MALKEIYFFNNIFNNIYLISVWGKIEIVNIKTARQVSNILSHLMYHRTKNLNGYELKVGLFEQSQSIMEMMKVQSKVVSYYSDIFKEFDEIVLSTITEYIILILKSNRYIRQINYMVINYLTEHVLVL